MSKSEDKKLDKIIEDIINTFKFHGITITNMNIKNDIPSFNITVSKSHMIKSLDDTLDLAYWALWTLIYGKYDQSDISDKDIELNYKEIE